MAGKALSAALAKSLTEAAVIVVVAVVLELLLVVAAITGWVLKTPETAVVPSIVKATVLKRYFLIEEGSFMM